MADPEHSTEMVERIASAIRNSTPGFMRAETAEAIARVAIEAMLIPTQPMIDAGQEHVQDNAFDRERASTIWDAMISAALAQP